MTDHWNLVVTRQLDKAVSAYTEALEKKNHSPTHRNRATALLLLNRHDEAFRDILAAEALDPVPKGLGYFHSDTDQLRLGVLEWLMGKQDDAGNRWARICEALLRGRVAYSDGSHGIGAASLLRFAAARLAQNEMRQLADKLISKRIERRSYRAWPFPIGRFYFGELSANHLLAMASDTPILRDRHLCQIQFAIAVTELERSDIRGYHEQMARAASYSLALLEDEYFLAIHESNANKGA